MVETTCVLPSVLHQPRKPQVDDSLAGKLLRRWNFCFRYVRARAQADVIRRFPPIVERFFDHEWLAGARGRLRFIPGSEERELRIPWPWRGGGKYLLRLRWMPWREEGCSASWSAPVTVTLFKKGKDGGKPAAVRYMSLFIKDDILHIAQLQGVLLVEMPKGLRDWAERFVQATMEFARDENFRGVWVARAESLYSYHHPTIRWFLPPEDRERELKRIRAHMKIHHNETAGNLGFLPEEDWFKWQNPNYKPR